MKHVASLGSVQGYGALFCLQLLFGLELVSYGPGSVCALLNVPATHSYVPADVVGLCLVWDPGALAGLECLWSFLMLLCDILLHCKRWR